MQIKFKRSTGQKGMLTKSTTYILDATVHATADEINLLNKHTLFGSFVWSYSGDERRQYEHESDEVWEKLTATTFYQLTQTHRFEYNRLEHVIRTEENITKACQGVLGAASVLETFDGSERVIEVTEDEAKLVAST